MDREQVEKAVAALLKLDARTKEKRSKQQSNEMLFDDEGFVYLVVSLKRTPDKSKTKPVRIAIPHTIYPLDEAEVCLIVKDKGASAPHKKAKAKVEEEGIAGVKKVIGVSKLKTDYKQFEAKRQLCNSYDIFLADDRVLPVLPKLLGKTFFKKKRHPVPIDMTRKNLAKQIHDACAATYMYQTDGSCVTIRVARVTNSAKEICSNIESAIEGVAGVIPRGWKNIKSLFLKLSESPSLPIFQDVGEPTRLK